MIENSGMTVSWTICQVIISQSKQKVYRNPTLSPYDKKWLGRIRFFAYSRQIQPIKTSGTSAVVTIKVKSKRNCN